jgi:hypothetical protein
VLRDSRNECAHAPLTLRATKEMVRRIQVHRRLDRAPADDLIALYYTSENFKGGGRVSEETEGPRGRARAQPASSSRIVRYASHAGRSDFDQPFSVRRQDCGRSGGYPRGWN